MGKVSWATVLAAHLELREALIAEGRDPRLRFEQQGFIRTACRNPTHWHTTDVGVLVVDTYRHRIFSI